ncbi:hypothetical protein KSF73_01205 [Burkholderiaceae bacterium DAT-1]|nr:hypothetical protein [Burkholderiaceae bacterium DAT-1]
MNCAYESKLDQERPYELACVPALADTQSRLQYRYLDTGETVEVPNLWFNQTYEIRARDFERQAETIMVLAEQMARRESHLLTEAQMARKETFYRDLAAAYHEQAARFREEGLRHAAAMHARAEQISRMALEAASKASIPAWQIPANRSRLRMTA